MPSKQRIIYIHSGEWPSRSPSIVFVTGTAAGIAPHCPVTLIVRNNSERTTPVVFRAITGRELPGDLEIVRVGGDGSPPSHHSFYREAMKYVGERAKRDRVAAVITRTIGFLPYLGLIKFMHSVPCYFETHDFYGDFGIRSDLKKTANTCRNHWYERFFLGRLDGVICLTGTQEGIVRKTYPGTPVTVAPTGLFRVVRPARPREKKICYVGSLDPHKGLGTLLAALSETTASSVGLRIIGGKNEVEKESFFEFANLMGLGHDRLEITGWVNHTDIGSFMDSCMAGVVPLADTPFNRLITSPLKILDCYSRCLPVIASDLPSVREYVTDGVEGILVPPGDSGRMAEAIDRFADLDLYGRYTHNVEQRAKTLTWEQRGKRITEFLSGTARG